MQGHLTRPRYGSALAVLLPATLLLGACAGATDVALHFDDFTCSPTPPSAQSLALYIGEPQMASGSQVLRPIGPPECLNASIPMRAPEVHNFFAQRGFVVQGVPADRVSRLAIILRTEPGCATGAAPVCLLSDPVQPGGEAQNVRVQGLCAPPNGVPPAGDWRTCTSVFGAP